MFSYLVFGITYGFIAAVQPGPLQTYIISQTINKGWKSTLPASIAPIISDIPIFIFVIFLLNNLPSNFIIILKICGGIFFLFLGYKTYKTWKNFVVRETNNESSRRETLLNAVTVNLLNPNPYLGWSLIMGPLFLEGWNTSPIDGLSLVVGFYTTMAIFLVITILLFAYATKFGPKVSKVLLGLSSIAMFAFGFYQLWNGWNTLLHSKILA